jgi:hypothetical protein
MMCMVTVDLGCRPLTSWGRWGRCRGEGEEGSNHLCGRGRGGANVHREAWVVCIELKCLLGQFFVVLIRLLWWTSFCSSLAMYV